MITTTLGRLVEALPALVRLAEKPLPSVQAYYLGRMIRAVRTETDAYEQQRRELIRRYGTEREPTEQERAKGARAPILEIRATDAGWGQYVSEVEALMNVAVSIERPPVDLSMVAGIEIPARDVLLLDDLVIFMREPTPEREQRRAKKRA